MSNNNKLPTILSKEHIEKMFEAVYIPKISIAMFMSAVCGLRVNEIRTLEISDINLKERKLLIRNSKNPNRSKEGYGKDRIIPIPECAISPMKKWLSIVEGHTKWFLPSSKSLEFPVSKEYLHNGLREAVERAGLNAVEYVITYKNNKYRQGRRQFRIKWHSLRHFYASYVYEKTRDLYAVSKLMGHNQVTTTQIYARVSDKITKDTIDFAFNMPIKTKVFQQNPLSASNIPTIAREKEKTPVEILEERFAKGEISASDFQTALRLLKIRKDYLNDEKPTEEHRAEVKLD